MTVQRMNKDLLLFLIWILALAYVVAIPRLYSVESSSFYGIAETKELVANYENNAEIKRINVVEGQSITKGQLLVVLGSPELGMKINQISHKLDQLKAQKGVSKSELQSKIERLRAEKASKRNEINNQIRDLENQLEINKALTSRLKSIKAKNPSHHAEAIASNPIQLKIESLKQELALSLHPMNIEIDLYQNELDAVESPIKIQIERLQRELELLTMENNKLNIYSQINGVIGSINYKAGEKVEPFAPILTLHTKNPLIVKGFIHENVYSSVSIGEKVRISAISDGNRTVWGQTVGVGSRIVEYPVRLRKHPDFKVWGREIIVKMPENNSFILGEKVMIATANHKASIFQKLRAALTLNKAHALNEDAQGIHPSDKALTTIGELTNHIEASGLLFLEDINRYLLASDDTPQNSPILFLMDDKGRIVKESTISGLAKISDVESMTTNENGVIFVASSASVNKQGRVNESRRLLIALSRDKDTFKLIRKIDLSSVLKNAAYHHPDEQWAQFILKGLTEQTIDIEGMFHDQDALYLGLKSPLLAEKSVILKLDEISKLLHDPQPDDPLVSIWQTVKLMDPTDGIQERISDLCYDNGQLYLTGSVTGRKSGSLWRLDLKSGRLQRLIKFDTAQPEGVAKGSEKGTLALCFDQGEHHESKMALVPVAP